MVGSTLRNRRIVAEHILAAGLKTNELALLSFAPVHERHLLSYDCKGDISLFRDKVAKTEPHAIALSSENEDWAL